MRDSTLIKISLAWALIGIFILLSLAAFAEPQQRQISDLNDNVGKTVVVFADIKGISYKTDVVFLTLQDSTGEIPGVFFGNQESTLSAGDSVAAKGKIQMYRGELEIVVQEIICTGCK